MGGIDREEIKEAAGRYKLADHDVVLMFGYQAEPTPTEQNNLARIAALRDMTGLEVGFMDHSEGSGEDAVALSAMALALGVNVFEKHIGLDRELELEDFVSALSPGDFSAYTASLRRLAGALGSAGLTLTNEEMRYRGRALKRVLAARKLPAGTVLTEGEIKFARTPSDAGFFGPREAVGKELASCVDENQPITLEVLK